MKTARQSNVKPARNAATSGSASSKHYQIISSEDLLREPSRATEIAAQGTSVRIEAGKATIILGPSYRIREKPAFFKLVAKIQYKIFRTFRHERAPLDVTWIE